MLYLVYIWKSVLVQISFQLRIYALEWCRHCVSDSLRLCNLFDKKVYWHSWLCRLCHKLLIPLSWRVKQSLDSLRSQQCWLLSSLWPILVTIGVLNIWLSTASREETADNLRAAYCSKRLSLLYWIAVPSTLPSRAVVRVCHWDLQQPGAQWAYLLDSGTIHSVGLGTESSSLVLGPTIGKAKVLSYNYPSH